MYNYKEYTSSKDNNQNEYRNSRFSQTNEDNLKERNETLEKIEKNFYKPSKEILEMSEKEVNEFREKHNIKVFGKSVPNPVPDFDKVGFPDYIMKTIKDVGFTKPTPIQAQSWPICLSGKDIIGLAETGSGKTLAFLLPAIIHLKAQRPLQRGDGPIALILAPTRELAIQINKECLRFVKPIGVRTCCVYGGGNRNNQIYILKQGVEIVIATPGRLIDLLKAQATSASRVSYLVLDEADRMLDMGFEPQIREIISKTRTDRQTCMYSATWNKQVQQLAYDFLNDPMIVNIGSVEVAANHKVMQRFLFIQEEDKLPRLVKLLDDLCDGRKIIIFVGQKKTADVVTSKLRNSGWPALAIHGDKSQMERDWVMSEFRSGSTPIMIATDVAARGLDIYDIQLVINYDMPKEIESYVHRIGRTARAGAEGTSISFFTPTDIFISKKLKEILVEAQQPVPPQIDKLINLTNESGFQSRGRFHKRSYGGEKRSNYDGRDDYSSSSKRFKNDY